MSVVFYIFFFLMIRRPPRSTRTDTLFPYTTLFRSNNSTNPRLPTLLTGQDYRDIPGFTDGGIGPTYPYGDPSLRVNLRTEDDNDAFSFGDRAIRIAAAGRIDRKSTRLNSSH